MKRVFTKTNVAVLILAFACGIIAFSVSLQRNRSHFPNAMVLKYADFGPPSSSFTLLGSEWYQWNSQGPDNPKDEDDVRVVVYRNIDLETVKKTYPVLEGKHDYRYVEYSEAMSFLEKQLGELKAETDMDPSSIKLREQLISRYEETRTRIIDRLGP